MNCDEFRTWLENRDLSDQSESDRALKHQKECTFCQEMFEKDQVLEKIIRERMKPESSPEHLEKIVSVNLREHRARGRSIPTGVIRTFSMLAGACAVLLIFLLFPNDYSARNEFGKALAQDHIMHNYDVDLEKIDDLPGWLARKAPFGAKIPEKFLSSSEYSFLGGRICPVGPCQAVHLVYRTGSSLVSLYIIDAKQVSAPLDENRTYTVSRKGYTIKMWKDNNQFVAVVT